MAAVKGASVCILCAIVMADTPRRKYRRVWRRLVRSQAGGRRNVRRDKRPELFGPEKPPHDAKKIYHYYCNKIYKVIRESSSATLDMPPAEGSLSSLDPQKAVVRKLNDAAEQFVKPAIWNKPLFRAAALVLGGALAGQVCPFAPVLHLSAFGIWLGTNVWTTFIAGLTMFKNLPRQTFGKLQAVLFPKYFQLGTACTAAVLLTGVRMGLPAGPALVSLICTLANLVYLSPTATDVMLERYDRQNKGLKDAAVDKDLAARFGKLHGLSSLANLIALVALVAHGVLLAARL